MSKKFSSLRLVSLATIKQNESFICLLGKLCGDILLINAFNWLQRRIPDPNEIIILVLPTTDIFVDRIINAISATSQSHYLVLFSPLVTDEVNSILHVCDDCCSWDCDESELAFRLNRIVMKYKERRCFTENSSENKIWSELNLIGVSKVFQDVLAIVKRAANCDAPVLIEGDTGCGKEMITRAIHYLSCRKDYPFVPINCGAVPDHLIENELFGHEKGAYTDAKQSYAGSIEQANGGTLFLDEIEALSSKGQVTLLRFIEDKIIKPLGAKKSKKVNVRIVVASNVSLKDLVAQGLFRKDLLYRLNLLYVYLPPLSQRENDITYLAEFFMQKYRKLYQQPNKKIHIETEAWMNSHHWPGNVRELENFIHRSFLLSENVYVRPEGQSLPAVQANLRRNLLERRQDIVFDASFSDAKNNTIKYFEKQYLSWIISKSNGNVTLAANIAKKERRALGKLLKKHDIDPAQYKDKE